MSDERTGQDAWRALYAAVRDDELILAMRASANTACQWLIGWLDEIYYPWQARGKRGSLLPPAWHAWDFFPLFDRAIAAARCDMEATAAEFARLWPPTWPHDEDKPLFSGASDWPEQRRTRDPKQRGKR